MNEKLEPCPFCGDGAFLYDDAVRCKNPDCGVMVNMWFKPEQNIASWNRRAATAELDALRKELEDHRRHAALCPDHFENKDPWVRESALKAAEERERGLREALARYGKHHDYCKAIGRPPEDCPGIYPKDCDCGLTAALTPTPAKTVCPGCGATVAVEDNGLCVECNKDDHDPRPAKTEPYCYECENGRAHYGNLCPRSQPKTEPCACCFGSKQYCGRPCPKCQPKTEPKP